MKTTFAVLALGASIAAAQDLSSLPACGQTCIGNMLQIASSEFGCGNGDIACYCGNVDFGNGVRDCSNEACPSSEEANQVIAFGSAYCASYFATASPTVANSAGSILSSALETASATGGDATATTTEGDASATGDATASGSEGNGGAQSTAITTEALVATVVSGDQTILQTTGFSTIYSALSGATDSAGSAIASATDSAGSAIASATDSAGSAIASATDSAGNAISSATDAAGSAASSAASAATAASSGLAPMVTALPYAGAAGIAAMLFL